MATETVQEFRRVPPRRRILWGALCGVAIATVVSVLTPFGLFQGFELKTVDWRQSLFPAPPAALDRVAVVMIDDYSVAELRKQDYYWPWNRGIYEYLLSYLRQAGAKAILFDLVFADPQGGGQKGPDAIFAGAIREAGNVYLAAKASPRPEWQEDPAGAAPDAAAATAKAAFPVEGWSWPPPEGTEVLIAPIPELTEAALGLGLVNVEQDPADNTVRRAYLAVSHGGKTVASLPLQAARSVLAAEGGQVEGRHLVVGDARIPLGADGRALVRFYGGPRTVPTENAHAVIQGAIDLEEGKKPGVPPEFFRDRVVVVGVNIAGMEDVITVPVSTRFRGPEFMATVVANILGGDFLIEPDRVVRYLILLAVGLGTGIAAFALWKPALSLLAVLGILGLHVGVASVAFRSGVVLDLFFPALVLGGISVAQPLAAYFTEGRQRREVSRAFGQYLSPIVIRDLLRNPESLKLGGETREITVFFSDIRGFSTFSEGMTPEELVSFLNVYLSSMTDAILDLRGVIDKYIGDAIMAFWGAPVPVEDHALQACLAVLSQRQALAGINERFQAEGRPIITFRAGLASGPATVGNMGSSRRFAYTAMGDTVNTASRLEGANKFFGTNVMMTEAVRDGAGETIATRRLGRIQVVGKSVPTTVYELLGRTADLPAADAGRLGRYHEALALLEGGDASGAAERFEALSREAPDPVVDLCLRKAREVLGAGKPWGGVWVLTEKG